MNDKIVRSFREELLKNAKESWRLYWAPIFWMKSVVLKAYHWLSHRRQIKKERP
ncbi:hypothetical protein [Pseudomonas gingeri]|uniref:Uncharacterized protein n=1 Tax=Pseudomonas gingeri TaxID=117681 RepID=A0A7Y7WI04_9PSED|nr:hypothetical protein [Pseudomonas gingeri]NWB49852.1 hypothetical protein [Pseudomonas gingeri]